MKQISLHIMNFWPEAGEGIEERADESKVKSEKTEEASEYNPRLPSRYMHLPAEAKKAEDSAYGIMKRLEFSEISETENHKE